MNQNPVDVLTEMLDRQGVPYDKKSVNEMRSYCERKVTMDLTPEEHNKILKIKNRLGKITKGNWQLETQHDVPWIRAPKENPKHGYDIEVFGEDDTQYSTQLQDFTFAVYAPTDIKFLLELLERKK